MARYKIQAPDGSTFVIEGPDDATDDEVLQFAEQQFSQMQPQKPAEPELSTLETVEDVAKSAGVGLAEGGIGLATLPGNVEALGRMGINAAAGVAGFDAPVSNETVLPTFDDWKKRVEGYTGEFYKPKTTYGEYSKTIGEFAPLALGGGASIAARSAQVLAPALASETAGQLTEGTSLEPWARLGGALAGGVAGSRMLTRPVTPNPIPRERAQQIATLENSGVNAMTAGQRTGNKKIRWAEEVTSDTPGAGNRAKQINDLQQTQFTRAALQRAGINADRATPEVIDDAFRSIGAEYRNVANGLTIQPSPQFVRRLSGIAQNYERVTPEAARVPIIRNLVDEFQTRFMPGQQAGVFNPGGVMAGDEFAGIRSTLARTQRGLKSNPQAYRAMGDMIRALDAKMLASVPRGQRTAFRENFRDLNRRYKNMLAIEDAAARGGEAAAMGVISPAALKNAIKKQDIKGYTRNRNDMAPLARAGEALLKPLPQSGTGPRSFYQAMFSAPTAAIGAMVGGTPGAAVGALAPIGGQALAGRALMSRPVQNYLANQALPATAEPLTAAQRNILAALLASQATQSEGR